MEAPQAAALRHALVDRLKAADNVRSPRVEAAMRDVPRHLFAPWLTLHEAYADKAFVHPDTTPDALSTLSHPAAVALMLEAFDLEHGMSVLEVGAGTGYSAALMAHIVGERGRVVTVDIEEHLVRKARARLIEAGFGRVEVVHGDGALGFAPQAPYHRMVATVGLWEVPPAWLAQLAPLGRLVAPLHLAGEAQDHELVNLGWEDDHLAGHGVASLGMVVMRGLGAAPEGEAVTRAGPDWQGATVERLSVKIYPREAHVQPATNQKLVEKRASYVVLERQ